MLISLVLAVHSINVHLSLFLFTLSLFWEALPMLFLNDLEALPV